VKQLPIGLITSVAIILLVLFVVLSINQQVTGELRKTYVEDTDGFSGWNNDTVYADQTGITLETTDTNHTLPRCILGGDGDLSCAKITNVTHILTTGYKCHASGYIQGDSLNATFGNRAYNVSYSCKVYSWSYNNTVEGQKGLDKQVSFNTTVATVAITAILITFIIAAFAGIMYIKSREQ